MGGKIRVHGSLELSKLKLCYGLWICLVTLMVILNALIGLQSLVKGTPYTKQAAGIDRFLHSSSLGL